MSTTSFTPPFSVKNSDEYKDALTAIHDELHTITKNITYLDAYNIVDVVTDSSKFGAQIAALSNNSSLVINSQPFFYNNVSYNTGDIVLKITSGEVVHIQAQPGGIFYPYKVDRDSNGNYSIKYQYSKTSPETNTPKNADVGEVAPLGSSIEFKGLSASDSLQSYVYGVWAPLDQLELPVYKYEEKEIQPQIQFWFVNEQDGIVTPIEELCIEYTLTQNNSKWIINIDEALDQYVEDGGVWVKVK